MSNKYKGNELLYLSKVLEGDAWSSTHGCFTHLLEDRFAKEFNNKYAVAFNSGTSTLHAALEAYEFDAGCEVISPALTVIMNTTATKLANLRPIYADINPYTFNITPETIKKKITNRTVAIMLVSLYGLPCDMEGINKLAKEYNLVVIEDNAQAMKKAEGDVASYSFEASKHISCGEGGMILTDNEEIATRIRKIGNHGFKNSTAVEGRTRLNSEIYQDPDYERHDELGWNYRMSEFQAAVALAQLERLNEIVFWRIKSATKLRSLLDKSEYFKVQLHSNEHTYYTLGAVYNHPTVEWKEFRRRYVEFGGKGIYGAWKQPYKEPVAKRIGTDRFVCPIADAIQPKIMQFPTNMRNDEEIEKEYIALEKTLRSVE